MSVMVLDAAVAGTTTIIPYALHHTFRQFERFQNRWISLRRSNATEFPRDAMKLDTVSFSQMNKSLSSGRTQRALVVLRPLSDDATLCSSLFTRPLERGQRGGERRRALSNAGEHRYTSHDPSP